MWKSSNCFIQKSFAEPLSTLQRQSGTRRCGAGPEELFSLMCGWWCGLQCHRRSGPQRAGLRHRRCEPRPTERYSPIPSPTREADPPMRSRTRRRSALRCSGEPHTNTAPRRDCPARNPDTPARFTPQQEASFPSDPTINAISTLLSHQYRPGSILEKPHLQLRPRQPQKPPSQVHPTARRLIPRDPTFKAISTLLKPSVPSQFHFGKTAAPTPAPPTPEAPRPG
jgi:hypothetical protein